MRVCTKRGGKGTATRAVGLIWMSFRWRERPGWAAWAQPLPGVHLRVSHPQRGWGAAPWYHLAPARPHGHSSRGIPPCHGYRTQPRTYVVFWGNIPCCEVVRDAWDGYSGIADYSLECNLLANRF